MIEERREKSRTKDKAVGSGDEGSGINNEHFLVLVELLGKTLNLSSSPRSIDGTRNTASRI